ncbi:branched-chain amino acid ABC transporter permease [Halocatena halophila]|uniref:branched-chain amino acid ABC transporter permease n=1 Tax=Halocatena halophila TaxID=2814576 RepID=UPI0038B3B5C3
MNITHDTIAERVREQPTQLFVGLITTLFLADLLLKLQGTTVLLFDTHVLGGSIGLSELFTYILDGLIVGIAVGLAGIGLSMTYSILNFANFAHGEYLTSGAFVGWATAAVVAGGSGVADRLLLQSNPGLELLSTPIALTVGLCMAAISAVGLALLLDRLVYKPMREAEGISLLIASIGVALLVRYTIAFIWQTGRYGVTGSPTKVTILNLVTLTTHELTLLVLGGVSMVGVAIMLEFTKLGTAMRAMADNESLARVSGIPVEQVTRLTWIVGGGLTGIAGYLFVLESGTIAFNFGWINLLLIFSAVILGGIGSVYGAMVGGVLIGLVDKLAQVWIPSDLTRAAVFVVLIAVLLVRPTGLFGGVKTA